MGKYPVGGFCYGDHMTKKRADTFEEAGNEQGIRRELWDLTDAMSEVLHGALFDADADQDPEEIILESLDQFVAAVKEHLPMWMKGEPLKKSSIQKAVPQPIVKIDEEQQLVFGYFNVSKNKDGELMVDLQGDIITPDMLEKAAYDFVLESREGGNMHEGDAVATLVESMVFTPEKLEKMGLAPDAVPARWWGGFKIHDPDVFEQVKKGELSMFSIQGEAIRVEVE